MKVYEKTQIPGFLKDTRTNAIINTQTDEMAAIRKARQKKQEQESLRAEVDRLRNSMENIEEKLNLILKVINK